MNKYYYPINLIESIDKLFLSNYSEILFYIFMAIFILTCVSIITSVILAKRKICKITSMYYNTIIIVSILISFSFVYYLSIPFIIFANQILLFYYNNQIPNNKINKFIVILILGIVIIITLLVNTVVFNGWIL